MLLSGFLAAALVLTIIVSGCKKDIPDPPTNPSTVAKTPDDKAPTTGTRDQLTKDSIFLYARQVYLWYDAIPDYQTFNPRSYNSYSSEIFALTRFGKDPLTGLPYEYNEEDSNSPKFSYVSDITQKNPIAYIPATTASVDIEGNGNDFGLLVSPRGEETNYSIYVKAVYGNSPAERAGFKRGDRFNIINDKPFGKNFNAEYNIFYNALFVGSSITIEGTTSNNTPFKRTLYRAVYNSSPIYKDSVYLAGQNKIGYISYARFSNESNSLPEFSRVFKKFSDAGVTDLIVDLRYNGGGYVGTAEHLINYIAPLSLNGKIMFSEVYNQLMQQKKAAILSKQPFGRNGQTYANVDYSIKGNTNYFQKLGTLNTINKVVFIITEGTASASELVINSLKPHIDVKIVGSKSYGKPVGYFPIRIDKYDVYLSMFETRNSKGEGRYYNGFEPDTKVSTTDDDNPNFDFGDLREASFKAAYNYITKGTFVSEAGAKILSVKPEIEAKPLKPLNREFKGMIHNPSDLNLTK